MDHKIFGTAQERRVPLREIDPDRGVQMREGFDARKAAQYAERYLEGVKLPPVVLFHDGAVYYRADGAHRIMGARQADLEAIDALVYEGGRREALLYAAGANADFGLDRTDETIRTSILTLLRDGEWYEWSDRAIARHVTCSHTTVAKLRRQVDEERAAATRPAVPAQPGLFDAPQELVVERDPEEPRLRKGADNRTINTSKIGKKKEKEEERLLELLEQARDLGKIDGTVDAHKGPRSQGELVRALGACPAGKLEVLWAAYRAALEEARAKAQAKTFQPASEATEALRGKPVGGPPPVPKAEQPPIHVRDLLRQELEDDAEEEPEEALCRVCGLEVCDDEEACLAKAEEEDGEDLDEDDGAEEAPRVTALSVLGGLVRNLTSDPVRKGEVSAELLRLAGELGSQRAAAVDPDERVADLQMEVERLAAANHTLVQQREETQRRGNLALSDRDRAERERDGAQERERDLLRTLFGLARTWSLQPGLEGPRAALLEVLDASPAQQVALWEHQLDAAAGQAAVTNLRRAGRWKALARALRKRWQVSERNDAAACAELQEARKEIATLKAGAKPPAKPGKEGETWRELGRSWGSPGYVLSEVESWAAHAGDAEWIAATQLEHRAGLEWPDALRPAERAELLAGIREALAEPAAPPPPVQAARAKGKRAKAPAATPALRSAPEEEVVPAAEEKRCEKCGCTSDKACEGGCFWVTPTLCSTCAPPKEVVAKVQEISAAQRAKHARALEIATEQARLDAAGALPLQRARQSLLHVVAKQYGSMDAPLCKKVWAAYQEAWERAKAAPTAPAAAPPAPATAPWQPASVGGAKAVHAVPPPDGTGAVPALCRQGPSLQGKGWTPRPGVALTCKGCLAATGSAS